MTRLTTTALSLLLLFGCHRSKEPAVTITPVDTERAPDAIPGDPFGSSAAAYQRLKEVTDEALAIPWSGALADFGPWLEDQTVAIERSLGLMKAIRVGPGDIYAVANGRIALVYEQIAVALTQATVEAEAAGHEADWKGQEDRIWEQASGFWARCVRGAGTAGPHLDAWDLRCRHGLANSEAKLRR